MGGKEIACFLSKFFTLLAIKYCSSLSTDCFLFSWPSFSESSHLSKGYHPRHQCSTFEGLVLIANKIYNTTGLEECLHNWSSQNLTVRTMQLNAWVADNFGILKSFFYLFYYNVITLKC